ncbi:MULTISPECIES: RepB family DNA primase [unclassified Bradyrhizobium]|uniref:RepB family DNA primase n=1 Tax=unclassified Bradyrhizobium TaxID=2631580 RepID=UPI001FFB80EA|nr:MULTISPECIES: RepB family DNA primase [unclassified Bradyrhizobium]MCK1710988.1 hypothetical protein [Bradyrhizobium sp. 143]MCK1730591.1 hypothetical protein [Bradyrhizobium sp. 142]
MFNSTQFDAFTKYYEDYAASVTEIIDRAPLFAPWEQRLPRAENSGLDGDAPRLASPVDFLKALFANTTGPVYTCSFSNERGAGAERHVVSRHPGHVNSFMEKWDKAGRGMFFCISTQKENTEHRRKENCKETNAGHVDIDFKGFDGLGADPRGEVLKQLKRLKYRPSAIVFSGNGIHVYYFFKEPVDTQDNRDRLEAFYRQLADVMAGDLAVCEVSRVVRLPGSHNSKDGASTPVEIIELHPDRRYDLEELEDWLSEQSPVMLRKGREMGRTVAETHFDFFAEYAKMQGIKPPIDVEARLNAMIYMGGGENSIHQTQIECAASMLSRGHAHRRGGARDLGSDQGRCRLLWRALELAHRGAQHPP